MSADAQPSIEAQRQSVTGLAGLLGSVISAGKGILSRRRQAAAEAPSGDLLAKCQELLHHRGEASGLALACEVISDYQALDAANRNLFFEALGDAFDADPQRIIAAANAYKTNRSNEQLTALGKAIEAPRVKLFRRMNMAPDATSVLVKMRGALLQLLADRPELKRVDTDLKHQFVSWFNRGFLELRVIDWNSPAAVLERIIRYEAVHEIHGWEDLRRRIALPDRRLYAFFHPALVDDPLIFVEVALLRAIPDAIPPILAEDRDEVPAGEATTAVFYSISNCQEGLRGISFGNFLIKQVVEELRRDLPGLKTFVTLSPVPGFRAWLTRSAEAGEGSVVKSLPAEFRASLAASDTTDAVNAVLDDAEQAEALREPLRALCAHYLVREKSRGTRPLDPVARFHLGNGARLERVHWNADPSANGRRQSFGLMVNYLYDLGEIEKNHEAFAATGLVAASSSVSRLLKAVPEQKKQTPDPVE